MSDSNVHTFCDSIEGFIKNSAFWSSKNNIETRGIQMSLARPKGSLDLSFLMIKALSLPTLICSFLTVNQRRFRFDDKSSISWEFILPHNLPINFFKKNIMTWGTVCSKLFPKKWNLVPNHCIYWQTVCFLEFYELCYCMLITVSEKIKHLV